MATSTGFKLLVTKPIRKRGGFFEVVGLAKVAHGDYATGGLDFPLNAAAQRRLSVGVLPTNQPPTHVQLISKAGWSYVYVGGTTIANGKVIIFGQKPTDATAGVIPAFEFTVAALPVSIQGTDEIQTISVTATGGTFTITGNGKTTDALAYNISLAAMKTALEALYKPGNILTVTGTPGSSYVITWTEDFETTDMPALVLAVGALTGGSASVAESTKGVVQDVINFRGLFPAA